MHFSGFFLWSLSSQATHEPPFVPLFYRSLGAFLHRISSCCRLIWSSPHTLSSSLSWSTRSVSISSMAVDDALIIIRCIMLESSSSSSLLPRFRVLPPSLLSSLQDPRLLPLPLALSVCWCCPSAWEQGGSTCSAAPKAVRKCCMNTPPFSPPSPLSCSKGVLFNTWCGSFPSRPSALSVSWAGP